MKSKEKKKYYDILIVEADERIIRFLTAQFKHPFGFPTDIICKGVVSGKKALEELESLQLSFHPHVILLDITLPDILLFNWK